MNMEQAQKVKDAAQAALEKVAADFGMTVQVGRGTVGVHAGALAARFVFAESGADERLFRAWADGPGRSYGLEPDDFGQEFTTEDGKRFKIVGLNPRARTGIIRATSLDDGGDWRFSGDAVMEALGRTRPEPVPVPEGRPF